MEKSKNYNNKNFIILIKEIIVEIISLINQHLVLLQKEFAENASRVVKSLILLLSAVIVGYAGLIFLGILLVCLLSLIIPQWVALLLVTAVYMGIPLIMAVYALNLIGKVIAGPKKSVTEFKKTGDAFEKWIKILKK